MQKVITEVAQPESSEDSLFDSRNIRASVAL